jgi:enamine deaminase RidA (YjgF/YER057c/UK114 family)
VRKELEAKEADFAEQLDLISQQILEVCKQTGADSIKTQFGTAMRSVKNKYWTNDWEKFYEFLFENAAPELLERRIHQTNMRQFLEENPELHPAGLNVDSTYAIIVRRSK